MSSLFSFLLHSDKRSPRQFARFAEVDPTRARSIVIASESRNEGNSVPSAFEVERDLRCGPSRQWATSSPEHMMCALVQ